MENIQASENVKGMFIQDVRKVDLLNEIGFDKRKVKKFARDINIKIGTLMLYPNWYERENKYYYLKRKIGIHFLNELVEEHLFNYMHLPTVHYSLALDKVENKIDIIGLFSENFRKKDVKYKEDEELTGVDFNYFWKLLNGEIAIKIEREKLLTYLMTCIYYDLVDRSGNTLIEKYDDRSSLAEIFDFDLARFSATNNTFYTPLFGERLLTFSYLNELLDKDEYFQFCYRRIIKFNMKRALKEICNQHGFVIDDAFKNDFIIYDRLRKEFLEKKLAYKK